jgi:hypothetical protein
MLLGRKERPQAELHGDTPTDFGAKERNNEHERDNQRYQQ